MALVKAGGGGSPLRMVLPKVVSPPSPTIAKKKSEDVFSTYVPPKPVAPAPAVPAPWNPYQQAMSGAIPNPVVLPSAPAGSGWMGMPTTPITPTAPVAQYNQTNWGNKFVRGDRVYYAGTIQNVPGIYRMNFGTNPSPAIAPTNYGGGGSGVGGGGSYGGGGGGGGYSYQSPFSMGLINWRI